MNWLLSKLQGLFAEKYIKSIVRTLLAALAGLLAGYGIDSELIARFTTAADPIMSGLIIYALAQVWSITDKTKNQK